MSRPRFDDISLAALDAAAAAGGSPGSWGNLLGADDLPLAIAVLEANLTILDARVAVLEKRLDRGGFESLGQIALRVVEGGR
jgi:hypothetical protein